MQRTGCKINHRVPSHWALSVSARTARVDHRLPLLSGLRRCLCSAPGLAAAGVPAPPQQESGQRAELLGCSSHSLLSVPAAAENAPGEPGPGKGICCRWMVFILVPQERWRERDFGGNWRTWTGEGTGRAAGCPSRSVGKAGHLVVASPAVRHWPCSGTRAIPL